MAKNTKVIKDLVHDYIEIDTFFESLINTKYFQRLRNIRQLTCQHVYPSANHTRFEHSLGVYHLSRRCLGALKKKIFEVFNVDEAKFSSLMINLSIASLLHDVGHAPLSHLGERYYRKDDLQAILKSLSFNRKISGYIFNSGASHELMSCYIILEFFYDIILNSEELEGKEYHIDFELICRMIVGSKYDDENKKLENIAIEILNSSTLDMDKLDYIMRDSYMTGISVPKIDVNRFFNGLSIAAHTNNLVVEKQAITVVQNIIDARDCLYLLVYNHHITVYTDFIYEFYIKHLILKYEMGDTAKTKDKLEPASFFDYRAICEKLVTDDDLIHKLKEYYVGKEYYSPYTNTITPQIFERKFLKPLWKNLYEYRLFMKNVIQDSSIIASLEQNMCSDDYSYRTFIAQEIIKETGVKAGEFFIIPRSNKFYSLNNNNKFYVYVNENLKEISELLPQKQFSELYNNVAFYIFCKEEQKELIQENFVKIVKKGLPDKGVLKTKINVPNWCR